MNFKFIRYAIVGAVANSAAFLFYMLFAFFGMNIKLAMTIVFIGCLCQTFVMNKSWTFSHKGETRKTFYKYAALYMCAYIINLVGLYVFVDFYGYNHYIVQAVMIVSLAVFLFTIQKLFVFTPPKEAVHE